MSIGILPDDQHAFTVIRDGVTTGRPIGVGKNEGVVRRRDDVDLTTIRTTIQGAIERNTREGTVEGREVENVFRTGGGAGGSQLKPEMVSVPWVFRFSTCRPL